MASRSSEPYVPEPLDAPVIDAHSHTWSSEFDADRDAVYARAWDAGLVAVVEVGGDAESSRRTLEVARADERLHAVAGVHPHEARHLDAQWEDLRTLAGSGDFVGLGEIGLDFYRNLSPPEVQYDAFLRQLDLAVECGLPVVIHTRDADEDTYEVLRAWAERVGRHLGPRREIGMLHCFSGNRELAERYVRLGFLVSVPGPVTYPGNERGQGVARTVPLDAMLVETDAPYLTPQVRRGRRNEPAYVVETVRAVAALRGCVAEDVARATAENAARLFDFGFRANDGASVR